MTITSPEPTHVAREGRSWSKLFVREMWASLAISVIWLAVLFDAIFGPDIVTSSPAGDHTVVPSAVGSNMSGQPPSITVMPCSRP